MAKLNVQLSCQLPQKEDIAVKQMLGNFFLIKSFPISKAMII